ncbi:MAG TPA: Asp-tRNA(Asn)/Glu-tRNA(Gln) amidotransferase subunit GatA [Candidatus Saccharimonadales bacterium]|nr:Asp-tRNA(Asn)/Glu-tRNA(Gln) amidotransferase subunit GatA [Candidatus Saccharimonadales bacterium]
MASQWQPLKDIAASVNSAEVSAASLVETALRTIEEKQEYKAIISLTAERARDRAKQIDSEVAKGENSGKLAGVPFIAKDNFLVFGAETTAASNMLKGFNAPYQATAIERLEAEGAICVAKANLDAFAHGTSTENSDFFTTLNPHDKTRVPGGSSGGSAAAVVLDMAPFALGTDTGGSIRQPASFSGCVGLKPTYGLVSRSGVVAMASSTDVIGPLTRSVEDAALVLDVISGQDKLDSTTIIPQTGYADLSGNLKGARVGLIKEYMEEGLQADVRESIEEATKKLKAAGAEIVEVSLPSVSLALAVYYIICPAEVSSNLARYDGQRYGYHQHEATTLDDSYLGSRGEGFGKEAKRRIIIGTYVLSSGYYDAYYKRAQIVRTKLIEEFEAAFNKVDFLIGPVAPTTAFKIGENIGDPLKMYLCDIMTVAANMVGNPAISIPAGMAGGLPVGLQIMTPRQQDKELLAFASEAEKVLSS